MNEYYGNMNVFVTGATGLLGSHLIYSLLHSGYEVHALRRPSSDMGKVKAIFRQYPDGDHLWQKMHWVDGNILDPAPWKEEIRKAAIVYHCAAVVSFAAGDQHLLLETNIQGAGNIASICLEGRIRLCYVSSVAALGDALKPGELIDEQTPVIPNREHSVYSESKSSAEKVIWEYIERGLNAVIVCPSVILGAGMWDRSSAQLYKTAARGILFYTKGGTGYVDVRDVVELMVRLAEDEKVKGERFVLNGGNYTFQELFTYIARANGNHPPHIYLSPWMTAMVWRFLALGGKLVGRKPAFTRETARSAHHVSHYSSSKILSLYPDFHFYPIQETIEHIRLMLVMDASIQ